MTHHNDDARMSELYAERAAGGEHEWCYKRPDLWIDHGKGFPFKRHIQYRLKQPKPKELEVWVGNCDLDGFIASDRRLELSEGSIGYPLGWAMDLADALNIPVGQQRKYKLVPVEDGE